MSLGENIKNKRQELKLSQEYVADQLGVSRQAVSKWETGQSEPTASNLTELATIFEISLSELVDPQKYAEEQKAHEHKVLKKDKAAKMWVSRFMGYILVISSYRIFLQNQNESFSKFGFIVMGAAIALLWISSKDYFKRAKLKPLQAVLGIVLIADIFFLPRLLTTSYGLNYLISDIVAIIVIAFLNLKYWRHVWKR